jgi:hypothetical protein
MANLPQWTNRVFPPYFHDLFPGHLRFSKNFAKVRASLNGGSACGTIEER